MFTKYKTSINHYIGYNNLNFKYNHSPQCPHAFQTYMGYDRMNSRTNEESLVHKIKELLSNCII